MQVVPLKELLKHVHPKEFWAEGLALALALLYLVNIFVGARQNKRIAEAWVDAFAGEGGMLRQQFSQLGIGVYLPHTTGSGPCLEEKRLTGPHGAPHGCSAPLTGLRSSHQGCLPVHWAEQQLCLLCAENDEGKKVTLLKESPSMYRQAQTASNPQGTQLLHPHPPLLHIHAHLTGVVAAHVGLFTCNVQSGVVGQSSLSCLCIWKAVLRAQIVDRRRCIHGGRRFYATGRRYCKGMMVTFDLRPRQDLFMGHLLHAVMPQDDIIDFEVRGAACTPGLAVKLLRELSAASSDPVQLTRRLRLVVLGAS